MTQLNPIQALQEKRRRDDQKMALAAKILWLPTYLLLVPMFWLIEKAGLMVSLFTKLNILLKEKTQWEASFAGYEPTSHDVIVSAYYKSGTNWTMQLAHLIANRGQAEFEHVHDVIPWPDGMPGYALDIQHDIVWQSAPTGLRIIKSHLPLNLIPFREEARYICVVRDPKEVMVSGYHFSRDTSFGPLTPSLDAFIDAFLSDDFLFGSWAQHAATFWAARHKPNVLFLLYPEMKRLGDALVPRLAEFMGVALTPQETAWVTEQSSFTHMRAINHKFYPNRLTPWSNPKGKMMRQGKVGNSGELLTAAQQQRIDAYCRAELAKLGSDFPYDTLFAAPSGREVSTGENTARPRLYQGLRHTAVPTNTNPSSDNSPPMA